MTQLNFEISVTNLTKCMADVSQMLEEYSKNYVNNPLVYDMDDKNEC